jgi:WD40 repeat protein
MLDEREGGIVSGQETLLQTFVPRRTVMKGLAAFTLAACVTGCASPPSSSSVSPTPTATPRAPGTIIYTYTGHSEQVLAVAWSPNGKRIVSGSRDMTLQVWDAFTGKHTQIFHGHTDAVPSVAWSPDNRYVASASWDKTVQLWDTATGQHVSTYRGHSQSVTSVTWSPDGRYLASGSLDKSVHVWKASTGALLYAYRGHTAGVTTVVWSPDGRRIASGSTDRSVQIYDALTGNHLFTYRGHTGEITAVTWSPDSQYIASGSEDKSVQTWNSSTGAKLYTYQGYNVAQASKNPTKGILPDLIYSVAWSHNGKRIAAVTQEYCGDECGVVATWDALNEGHFSFYPTFPMYALAWSPDDQHLVTANAQSSGAGSGTQVVQVRQA